MQSRLLVAAGLLALLTMGTGAQRAPSPASAAERLAGTWTGTWDGGGGSGRLVITIERGTDGALGGTISITGDAEYEASLTGVSLEEGKMIVKYNYPPDEAAEVVLTAPVEDNSAAGTWSLREKASGNEVATGGWKATRKAP